MKQKEKKKLMSLLDDYGVCLLDDFVVVAQYQVVLTISEPNLVL